jgi:excisionase family DNA binding protein
VNYKYLLTTYENKTDKRVIRLHDYTQEKTIIMAKTPIKVDRVMEITGLAKRTIYILKYKGEIPHFKFGPKALRFYEEDILEWMENRTHRPMAEVIAEKKAMAEAN